MGTDQTFGDRPLLEVVALLSSRGESGRLKIEGTTRGAFFFSKGKLVDAHMGPFHGFQAVNLAVSVGTVKLSFDPSIQSRLSTFNVAFEREILKARFGITAADPRAPEPAPAIPQSDDDGSAKPLPAAVLPEVVPIPTAPETAPLTLDNRPQAEVVGTTTSRAQPTSSAIGLKLEAEGREIFSFSRRPTNSLRRKIATTAGFAVFVLIVPATVALVSHLTSSSEAKLTPSAKPATVPTTAETAAPEPAKSAQNEEIKPQTSEAAPPTPRKTTTEPALETKTLTSAAQLQTLAEPTLTAAAKPKQAPAEAEPTKSSSQTIAVVVEINEGQVTEAYVKTPQHGMAAYEATALRLARQRRFPKGTNRRETINLQVTRER